MEGEKMIEQNTNMVGIIHFGAVRLLVYNSLNEPLFKANAVCRELGYGYDDLWGVLNLCEECDRVKRTVLSNGKTEPTYFVTERGLYSILAQSKKKTARAWRRIVEDEIIAMRRRRGLDISEQFEEWDHALDDFYFDDETGLLMQSVTTADGDVEQIPVED